MQATEVQRPDFDALDKADPDLLLQAVAIVQARYHAHGKQPGAECWQSDTRRYRPQMIADVFIEWSTLTGTDQLFPWHDDFVAEVWVKFRKTSTGKRVEFWNYWSIDVPPRFESSDG